MKSIGPAAVGERKGGAQPSIAARKREPVSSYAYRLFTFSDALGFMIVGIRTLQDMPFAAGTSSTFFNELVKLFAGLVVPGYLMWRNVTTWRAGQPMLAERLLVTGPWYFQAAVGAVWLLILATLVLPVLSRLAAGDLPVIPGMLSYDLEQWWRAALWLGGPAIFVIELCVVREGGIREGTDRR